MEPIGGAARSSAALLAVGWAVALGFLAPAGAQESAPPESLVLRQGSKDWAEVQAALDRGLGFLAESQKKQGGLAIGARYPVAVTSLSGLAVLGAGYHPAQGRFSDMLEKCLAYLEGMERMDEPPFIAESGNESRMHGHCYAVLFLTELVGSLPPEREDKVIALIRRGVRTIERAQSREGGWYYERENPGDQDEASVTVCALQALRAVRNIGLVVDSARVKRAVSYVKKCQLQGGSFCYALNDRAKTTFALSAAALSTLNAAGVYESPELRRGLDYLKKTLAEYRLPWNAAESEYRFYGNFYAAQTLYQDGGPEWGAWYSSVRAYLLRTQREDGSWEDRFGDEYATATALLILEVPMGYLPIFQR
jgi:hypothetical protein